MVMCSKCHKRVAVVFVNKLEGGNKISEGLCIRCARELGIPVDNMLGNMINQMGISPEQLENMEEDMNNFLNENLPSANDDMEEGGAPAIDMPQLFGSSELPAPSKEALMARIPLPVPTSSTRQPGLVYFSSSSMTKRVVSCVPVPKAIPGSMVRMTSPGCLSYFSHAGPMTIFLPM